MPARRGQCPVCRYRWRLRKDGTLQAHQVFGSGGALEECAGSRNPPRPFDPDECPGCVMYMVRQPFLAEACASVGIERGRSTRAILLEYLTRFHESGHPDDLSSGG